MINQFLRFVRLVIILMCVTPLLANAASKKVKKTVATESDDRGLAVVDKNLDSSKRVALVIGNSTYASSPLKNPVNDANDIATKLRRLGFEIIKRNNLKTKEIGGTLREFRSKLAPGVVALVFYAGHGLQIKGDNYLPTVDADINSEEDVPNQSLSMKQIMDVLDESKSRLNLVFLDACRNNPYARSFRTAGSGLARVNAPSGTLISYATKPGSVAADGMGRNGLYTSRLLAQMDSSLQIEQALKRVVTEVKAASKGKQEPWMEGSIEGDFCFVGCAASSGVSFPVGHTNAGADPASNREDSENALWDEVQKGNNKDDYSAYLAQYPNGKYAALAKSRINKLQAERMALYEKELAQYNYNVALYKKKVEAENKNLAQIADNGYESCWDKHATWFERSTSALRYELRPDPSPNLRRCYEAVKAEHEIRLNNISKPPVAPVQPE
jgi:hypothetical protein